MKKYLAVVFFSVFCTFITLSCKNETQSIPNKQETKTLSFEEAGDVLYEYTYYSKNGFELRITKEEALKKGVKSIDYDTIVSRISLANRMIELDRKKSDEICINIDSSRVDINALDKKISIIPKDSKKAQTRYNDSNWGSNSGLGGLSVEDPGYTTAHGIVPKGTNSVRISGSTRCTFGLFNIQFDVSGNSVSMTGTGLYPRSTMVQPAMVPSNCTLSISSTCGSASGIALFVAESRGSLEM